MKVTIRRFEIGDIPNKVKWINDPQNNTFLHYELPLEIEKTENWFRKNADRTDRYDAVIEADGKPVGLIGLLSIDHKHKKAEYYITLGERDYLGKGVAHRATKLLLDDVASGNGFDPNFPIYLGYTGLSDAPCRAFVEPLKARFGELPQLAPFIPVGCVIGTHVGPGACILCYVEAEN